MADSFYDSLKPEALFDRFTTRPTPYKPILTDANYRDGFVTRYFVKHLSSTNLEITEVDELMYKALRKNPLYQQVSFRWKIKGKLHDHIIDTGNSHVTVIKPNGERFVLTAEEFNAMTTRTVEDKVITNGHTLKLGVMSENRLTVSHADLTMQGIYRYIIQFDEFWIGP